jgi:hypothetical protein
MIKSVMLTKIMQTDGEQIQKAWKTEVEDKDEDTLTGQELQL